MTFARMDHIIATSRTHLDTVGARGTEIENYLVGYLLLRIAAEFEMCLEKICEVRAAKASDQHLVNVIRKWANRQTNCMKLSDLTGTVGAFGDDCKDSFKEFRNDPANNAAILAWDAIQSHRINVAHLMPANLSLADFEQCYADAQAILVALASSLSLTPTEISGLKWP
jgi:hypothetical protein